MGTFIILLLFYMLLIAIWLVIYPLHQIGKIRVVTSKLGKFLFWNNLIVIIFESIIIIAFVSLIKLKYNLRFDSFGEEFQSALTLTCMAGYIILPTFAFG